MTTLAQLGLDPRTIQRYVVAVNRQPRPDLTLAGLPRRNRPRPELAGLSKRDYHRFYSRLRRVEAARVTS